MLLGILYLAASVLGCIFTWGCKKIIWILVWAAVSLGGGLMALGSLNEFADFADCGVSIVLARILQIATILEVIVMLIGLFYNLFN